MTIKLSMPKLHPVMVTISKEDYLKEIYKISQKAGKVTTANIAARLNITNAATSEMAKKLDDQGLIKYERYKGVELTEEGRKIAILMLRRHRIWETFLIKILGFSWSQVHDEAEKLEHHSSDFLIDKIDEMLGFPEFDPHGDPIPDVNGIVPELTELFSLADAEIGCKYCIVRVEHDNNELLDYLTGIGIGLYTEIIVLDRLEFDKSIYVGFNNQQHMFSNLVASKLFVKNNNIE